MKSMIDSITGLYLTQHAYDKWYDGKTESIQSEEMWTADIDAAASFASDEAPPTDARYKIVPSP